MGVYADVRGPVAWATEKDDVVTKETLEQAFGFVADFADEIVDIAMINTQLYIVFRT